MRSRLAASRSGRGAALLFAQEHDLTSVVVLGGPTRSTTTVLNSNVPPLVREQGAMAIPVDCYRVD